MRLPNSCCCLKHYLATFITAHCATETAISAGGNRQLQACQISVKRYNLLVVSRCAISPSLIRRDGIRVYRDSMWPRRNVAK